MADGEPVLSLRRISAVAAGNALEFYSFLTFTFFASQIGEELFGPQDADSAVLLWLATFGVSYLARPLGAAVIGILGDTVGRKPAMLVSLGLMGVSIIGLALTPSYASIGASAAVLALLFRMLQGFALGGEIGPASALLLEAAPVSRRGFYVSLQFATQWGGGLAAALVWFALGRVMSAEQFAEWGWRIALLIGGAVVPVGLLVRARMPETLGGRDEAMLPPPVEIAVALSGLMMLVAGTIVTYLLAYLRGFAVDFMGVSPAIAFAAIVVSELSGTLANLLGGVLSDRVGRRRMVLSALGALLLVGPLCLAGMVASPTPFMLLTGTAAIAGLLGLATPSLLALILEGLPPGVRSGGVGIIYALAIAVFGSTTQFSADWLIEATGSPLAPAAYLAGALLLGLAGAAAMRETKINSG